MAVQEDIREVSQVAPLHPNRAARTLAAPQPGVLLMATDPLHHLQVGQMGIGRARHQQVPTATDQVSLVVLLTTTGHPPLSHLTATDPHLRRAALKATDRGLRLVQKDTGPAHRPRPDLTASGQVQKDTGQDHPGHPVHLGHLDRARITSDRVPHQALKGIAQVLLEVRNLTDRLDPQGPEDHRPTSTHPMASTLATATHLLEDLLAIPPLEDLADRQHLVGTCPQDQQGHPPPPHHPAKMWTHYHCTEYYTIFLKEMLNVKIDSSLCFTTIVI